MRKELKYINNIMDGTATILLYNQIGSSIDENGNIEYGINGTDVAKEIQYLNEVEKVENINIRINSIGGSVFDGYSIISAMMHSKATCNTYVDGLAASIAGVIAIAGKKCYMMDYSTLMLHNPSGSGVNDDILSYIKGTLVKIVSGRTKRTAEEIAFMMDGETWLNSAEAYKMGMCDEIISSAKEFKLEESQRKNMYTLANIYNKLIVESNQITNNMNENTEKIQADLQTAVEKLAAMESELTAIKAEKEQLAETVKTFEVEKTEKLEAEAITLVENAIKDGKIKEDAKDSFVALAKLDFTSVKNSLEAIETKNKTAVKIMNAVTPKVAERDSWSIRDWEKKAPKELADLYKNDREAYNELYNKFYKKTK